MRIAVWIKAFRLRTLPLAVATIGTGVSLAISSGDYSLTIAVLCLLTGILLQILSNLANDLGDAQKGTDNADRIGPERAIQSGAISPKSMKAAILVLVVLSLISGVYLLWEAFSSDLDTRFILFFLLGIGCIIAAIKYTVGKKAYGYSGWGDAFVLLFFGPVAVNGTLYLAHGAFDWQYLLPGISFGLLSAGVLNVNNMRDRGPDQDAGKITLAVKLGERKAKIYHSFLLVLALLLIMAFTVLTQVGIKPWLFALSIPLFAMHLVRVVKNKQPAELDPYLKQLALSILILAILFGIGINLN